MALLQKDLVDVDNQTTANKTAITIEESRAISDAIVKLAEAKADASGKVDLLKTSASADALLKAAAANLKAAHSEIEIARLAGVDYANAQIAIARTQIASSASTDAQTRANQARIDAISSSNLYAASEAAAQRLIAKAYADGKVTAEEQARIDQGIDKFKCRQS